MLKASFVLNSSLINSAISIQYQCVDGQTLGHSSKTAVQN